ncbi:MAG: hypothetical protein ACYC7E_06580 [Armatimonadota bacterium]
MSLMCNRPLLLLLAISLITGLLLTMHLSLNAAQEERLSLNAIEHMMNKAELLVVITPQKIMHNKVSVKVDEVYKGVINVGSTVYVYIPSISANAKGIGFMNAIYNHTPLLCFLTYVEKDHYTLTFDDSGNSKAIRYQYGEFAWLLVSGKRPVDTRSGIDAVKKELIAGLHSDDTAVVDDCATWLLRLDRAYLEYYIENYFANKTGTTEAIRFYLIYSKMRSGACNDIGKSIEYTIELSMAIKDNTSPEKISSETISIILRDRIQRKWLMLISMNFRIIQTKDHATIQILNKEIVENNQLRFYLITSSPNWADYSSIPYLIKVLPNIDADYQYVCLRVLARLTGRDIPPNYNVFKDRSNAVIADWLKWWKEEGAPVFRNN